MFALEENVDGFIAEHGLERVGFLTITFPRNVASWQESQRRFHNFSRRVLKTLFVDYICVLQFHPSDGRPHYHLLVACSQDIRAGFDFAAYQLLYDDARKPRASRMPLTERRLLSRQLSTNAALKRIWKAIRDAAAGYGVGRCETIPIRTNSEAVGRYVGGYISRSMNTRRPEHKGARLVRYSRAFSPKRPCGTHFSWQSEAGWVWRSKVRHWAVLNGCFSLEQVRARFGRRWAYLYRDIIKATALSWYPTGKHARADGHESVPADATDVHIRATRAPALQRPSGAGHSERQSPARGESPCRHRAGCARST